jgi:hypothetical protein
VCPDDKCSTHSTIRGTRREGVCLATEWWSRRICSAQNQYLAEGATCAVCEPGSFLDQTPSRVRYCAACPSGRFRDQEGGERIRSCSSCPAGTTSEPGSTTCSDCQAGRFSELWSPTCSACPAGTTSEAGSSTCSDCLPGRFAQEGSVTCSDCQAGSFAEEGSGSCTDCPAGRFAEVAQSGTCTDCPAGRFADAGSAACRDCPPGRFAQEGSGSCTDCPAGSFAENAQSETCSECPSNHWSDIGSAACSEWHAEYVRGDSFGRCNHPFPTERLSNEQCRLAVGSELQPRNGRHALAAMGSLQEGTQSGMAVPGRGCYVDSDGNLWRNPDGRSETRHSGSNHYMATAVCIVVAPQDE